MPPQREATLERHTAYVPTATSPAHGAMTGGATSRACRTGARCGSTASGCATSPPIPPSSDMIGELARVYDLQNSAQYRDEMTFVDPEMRRPHQRVVAAAALGRRSRAQAPQQRTVERAHLGPARPQPRHPRALHHFGAPPQG